MIDLDALDFEKGGGYVTVVCQDWLSGAVLMVAHANREALERTVATGEMHYWSRTRGLWRKGETSGNTQTVVELRYDCDADAILARVNANLPACHTGSESCFGSLHQGAGVLARVDGVIAKRAAAPAGDGSPSYTNRLLADRNMRLKKLGEEATELVTACADGDRDRACEEAADLLYHALVAVRAVGGSLRDIESALARREGSSGG